MKNAAVLALMLAVGVFGPQQTLHSRYDALWVLGVLVVGAYVLQQVAQQLRLPSLLGWLAAGVLAGSAGLHLASAQDLAALQLVRTLAALWVGFEVGIHFTWPAGLSWRGPLLISATTLVTLVALTLGIWALSGQPWAMALLLAAVSNLWGLFALQPTPARRGVLTLASVGNGVALLLLLAVMALLTANGIVPAAGLQLGLRPLISLAAGAVGALGCRRLGLFEPRAHGLVAGLFAAFFVAALLVAHWQLIALPFGFGAGVALVRRPLPARRLRRFLRSLSPVAYAAYFALMGATLQLRALSPPVAGLGWILAVVAVVLVVVRVLGPAVWYPACLPHRVARRQLGWLWLPKGAMLFELLYHPEVGLVDLLPGEPGLLLHQAALAQVVLFALVFTTAAVWVPRRWPRPWPGGEAG